ncbi:hypothetical protein GWK47_046340 [Chionoecetes opilio]|uniref:Uncharacterized protein n=1 Tax=Chionoecetes opilio TaxID=41210 RepID=A0A8J4Y5L5_CHIOP|nr:hypothetical protein GWK47_046340 [Chionoecetes opilio]
MLGRKLFGDMRLHKTSSPWPPYHQHRGASPHYTGFTGKVCICSSGMSASTQISRSARGEELTEIPEYILVKCPRPEVSSQWPAVKRGVSHRAAGIKMAHHTPVVGHWPRKHGHGKKNEPPGKTLVKVLPQGVLQTLLRHQGSPQIGDGPKHIYAAQVMRSQPKKGPNSWPFYVGGQEHGCKIKMCPPSRWRSSGRDRGFPRDPVFEERGWRGVWGHQLKLLTYSRPTTPEGQRFA